MIVCSKLLGGFGLSPQRRRNTAMRFKFQDRHTRFHSLLAAAIPRIENWRKSITDLMIPKTGSTVCLRRAYNFLPASVFNLCATFATRVAPSGNGGGSVKHTIGAG